MLDCSRLEEAGGEDELEGARATTGDGGWGKEAGDGSMPGCQQQITSENPLRTAASSTQQACTQVQINKKL